MTKNKDDFMRETLDGLVDFMEKDALIRLAKTIERVDLLELQVKNLQETLTHLFEFLSKKHPDNPNKEKKK